MSFLNRDDKGTGSNSIHSSSNKIMNINGLNGLKIEFYRQNKSEKRNYPNYEYRITDHIFRPLYQSHSSKDISMLSPRLYILTFIHVLYFSSFYKRSF